MFIKPEIVFHLEPPNTEVEKTKVFKKAVDLLAYIYENANNIQDYKIIIIHRLSGRKSGEMTVAKYLELEDGNR